MSSWSKLRLRIAPKIGVHLEHPQSAYYKRLRECVKPGFRWLDLGCGRQVVPHWGASNEEQRTLVKKAALFVGLDADAAIREHPLLKNPVIGWGDRLPFRDGSFDLITANMVMEHVTDPGVLLDEVWRVLSPGGRFLFHTPNRRYYLVMIASMIPDAVKKRIIAVLEKRQESDIFPTFYRMNTIERITEEAHAHRFRLETIQTAGPWGSFIKLGPLGLLELLVIRMLHTRALKNYRSTFVTVLEKQC
jgi:SAM-dependent methyltransferase